MEKKGEQLGQNRFKYTIDVNKLNEKLLPNSSTGTLTLTDVIKLSESEENKGNAYVNLVADSVKVFDKDGNDLIEQKKASYTYDQGKNTLQFTVPDGQALKIEYVISVSGTVDDKVSIENTVNLEGRNIEKSWTEKEYTIVYTNAELSGDNGTVIIKKKEKNAENISVEGAKFSVYEVSGTGAFYYFDPKNQNLTPVSQGTTDINGELTLGSTDNTSASFLKPDQLYCLVEEEVPEGYLLASTEKYHFFAMNASKDHQKEWGSAATNAGKTLINIPEGGTLTLTNIAKPEEISLSLNASKKINGTDVKGNEKFTFTAVLSNYEKSGQYYPGSSAYEGISESLDEYKKSIIGQKKTTQNSAASINFEEYKLKYEGTYTFEIKEESDTGNYVYDATTHTVKVTVARNSVSGDLEITSVKVDGKKVAAVSTGKAGHFYLVKAKNDTNTPIAFNNIETTSLELVKNVTEAVSQDTEFTFNVKWNVSIPDGYKFKVTDSQGKEIINNLNKNGGNITIKVPKNTSTGKVTISGIPVGTEITITEQGKAGWSQVNQPADGKYLLTINKDASKNVITVTNSYSASGTWTPKATKKLNAGGRKLKNNEFRFVVKDQAGNTVMTGSNNAKGNVTFVTTDEKKTNSISYTAPGTYIYTIEEVTPADGKKETNMSYSDAVYTVTVTVTDPNKDGTLDVKAVYVSSKESGEKTSAEFVNTYTAEGTWKPAVSKFLTGGAFYGEGFTYTVKDSTGKEVATGSNKDDGPISFTDITYDQTDIGKKYTYTIEETNKTRSDITYDDTVFTVSVEIEDKGNGVVGAKKSSVVYKKARTTVTDPAFTNKYKASGSAEIKGTKTLKNQILTAGAFTFGLFEDSAGTKPVKDASGKAITTTNKAARTADGKGEFVLNTPVYTQADIEKEYTYWVREIPEGDQRYTYDTAAYQVSVKVSNKGNGELNVAVTYSSGAINFTNTYTATGSLDVTATKTVKGRTDVPNIFKFELIEITGSTSKVLQTVTNNGSQVTFDPIPYQVDKDKDKTYTYILKEETGSAAGYVGGYSTEEYRITAKITDDGTGNLKVAKTIEKKNADGTYSAHTANNGVPSFTNTYKATGKLTLSGKKILENHALEKDQFTFELYKIENYGKENQSYTQIDQKKNNADGSFTFDELTFNENQVGDNYYAVREVDEEAAHPGYSYLKDYVIVKVTVTDDGQGNLTATATPNGVTGDTALTITNTYTAKGRLQLKAHKSLTGAALREDNKFSFTLTGPKNTNQTKPNDLDGNVVFDTLEYDQSDIGQKYVYTLTETDEGKAGYTYDSKIYTVTVEVKDNHNGTLSTPYTIQMQEKAGSTVTDYTKSSDEEVKIPEFSNSYEATGSAVLSGTKTLIGGTKELKAGDFSFKIYEVKMQKKSDDSDELVEVEEALKDAAGQEITVSNDAKGNFTFPEISYTQNDVGVHTYRIKEINDGKPGYTYDSASVEVTINVKDNHNKTLDTTERTYKKGGTTVGAINFENSYAANGSFTPQAIKALEGHKLSADQFTFVLYEVKDKEEKELERKTNDAAGVVSFKTRDYSQADIGKTFVYRIKEVNGGIDGYDYSKEEYTITVSVTDNNGSLTVTPVYTNKEGKKIENAEEVVFKNTYTATGDATISGTKTLTGNRTLDNEQFSFKLTTDPEGKNLVKDSEGNDMIVKNDADGNFTFPVLHYDQDDVKDAEDIKAGKDFTYYVSEIANPDDEVYTYSTRIYKVVINVKDDGGKLTVAEPVITDLSTGKPAGIAFENHYNAKGSLNLTATKKLDVVSDKVKLSANLFSFTLIGDNIEKQTKWNNEDGSVIFDSINYTEADIDKDFTYTMTEQYGKLSGFEYSNEVYTIKVHVSDNRDGSLNVDAKVTNSEGEDVKLDEIQFVNKYEATGSLTLEGTKVLNGRKLEAGKFTFALSENGKVLQTVANEEDGSIKFAPINYTTADIGIHTYTVQEVTPAADGNDYTYDRTIYTVVVEVSDNGDGTLNVDVRKENDKEPELKFTNTYKAEGKTSVTATKVLTGTTLTENNKFSFTLESTGIAPAYKETVQNGLNGSISFPEMTYTEADAGQTYTYLMYEEIPAEKAAGYTYDETVYHVEVTVTDNGDGNLEAKPKIYEISGPAGRPVKKEVENAQFTNEYHAAGRLILKAQKNLTGRLLADGQFAFILKGEGISQRKTNTLTGEITFDQFTYTEQDLGKTFTYRLYEDIPAEKAKGYTYDETEYEIKVTLKDNGDGTLTAVPEIKKLGTTDAETTVVEKAEFNNHYNADGELTLTATKNLSGRAITDGEFEFTLSKDGEVIDRATNEGTNVTFKKLTYQTEDIGKTYTYIMQETDKGVKWYTCDKTRYQVTVTITDKNDGTLNVAKTIEKLGENGEENEEVLNAVFNNEYKAEDTDRNQR
ncbi:MAG: FctA domain-containing protein [Lachnospiraceae bacterium]